MNKRIRRKILKNVHFVYKCDNKWGVEPDAKLLGYSIFQIVKAWFKERRDYINFINNNEQFSKNLPEH